MELTAKRLLALSRAAVFSDIHDKELFESLDAASEKKLLSLAKCHDIAQLILPGAETLGVTFSDEAVKIYTAERDQAVFRNVRMRAEFEAICEVFEEAKIEHLPLKGSVIRGMYPEPWMRTSCDIDILIREEFLDSAVALLSDELDYKYLGKGNHDVQLESPSGVHLELHYRALNEYSLDGYDKPLVGLFDRLLTEDGYIYRKRMSDEDFYYYHIAHMGKHYINGGCGIRTFLDLYILRSKYLEITEKCKEMLADGGLLPFEENTSLLSEIWFGGGSHTDLTVTMEEYILFSGIYGDIENRIAVVRSGGGGKLGYVFKRAFPSYKVMCDIYPSLEGKKILTPIYYLRRLLGIIFTPRLIKRSIGEIKKNESLSKEKQDKISDSIKKLGLRQ